MGSARLAGRDDALRLLGGMTAALEAGTGGAVLVSGEHGIGKTGLLRAALPEGAGYRLAWAESPVSFGMMADEILSGDSRPGLAAGPRAAAPLVVVAEDLHRADEATVLAWYRLSRAAIQLPLLVAGSVRPGNGRADLAQLRRGLASRGGTVIELAPLGPAEIAAVAAGVLGETPGPRLAGLLAWAGGNPRYARELAAGLADAGQVRIDDGVAELTGPLEAARPLAAWLPGAARAVAERLADVSAEVTDALRWAAILGAEFSATDLAVVTARPAERLMEIVGDALAAGLIEDADDGLRFRHDLIRRVLYEQTPTEQRGGLHEEAARGLAAAGAPPERIAVQLLAAPATATQPWAQDWVTGNAPVLARRAPKAAAELIGSVLARPAPDDAGRDQLRQALLTALSLAGRDDEVERAGREMLAAGPDPDLSLLIGYSLLRAGRPADAAGILRQAQRSVPAPSPVQAARLSALHANAAVLLDFARNDHLHNDSAVSGEASRDGALGEAGAALAFPGADPLAGGLAHHARGLLSYLDRDSHARLDHIDRGLAAAGNDTRFADLRLLLLAGRVNALDVLDRRADAVAAADLSGPADAPRTALVRLMLARAHYTYGSWDDALTQIGLITEAAGPDGAGRHAAALAALIAGHRGESMAAYLEDVSGRGDRIGLADLGGQPDALMARALAAEVRTGPASALTVLAACLEPGLVSAAPMRITLLPDLTRLAVTAGDPGLAQAAASAAAAEARRDPVQWKLAMADHCAGLAAANAKAVLAAAEYARGAGRILSCGRALEDAAVLMASGAGGDAAAARRLAADAVRQYTRLGAKWDIRRTTERLRDRGVRLTNRSQASRSGAGHPAFDGAGLTRTEDKIATLIAQGLSNPEIAARLSVSRNTVQTHVSHILAKLGTPSRGDIIRLAGQHPG